MLVINRPQGLFKWLSATNVALLVGLLFIALFAFVPRANAINPVSNGLVISQVYGAGGNGGATYNTDFIEIFNRGSSPISLNGKSLQYASATGTGNFGVAGQIILLPNATLAAGQYYLVAGANGANGAALPAAPDLIPASTINLSGTAGKIALVNDTVSLGCNGSSTVCTATQEAKIIDLVGYGTANYFETAVAPGLTPTTAAKRNGNGCAETNNNASDFTAVLPAPRNAASALASCVGNAPPSINVPTTTVLQGAAPFNIILTGLDDNNIYNWTIAATPAPIGVSATSVVGASNTASFTVQVTIPAVFSGTASFTVTLSDNVNPPVSKLVTISVTTITKIYEIQGASRSANFVNQVKTTIGVVTGLKSNGFFMQDSIGDGDDTTSDGIFVFTSSAPTVILGHTVVVTGKVKDFISGSRPTDAPLTEMDTITSIVDQGVGPAITPITITTDPARVGPNIRKAPPVIIDPAFAGVYDPTKNGVDFYEALEGMLVKVDGPLKVVGPTNTFGEIWIVPDGGIGATGLNSRGGIFIDPAANDFNPERLLIDDEIFRPTAQVKVSVGDTINTSVTGPLDYAFSNFRIQALSAISVSAVVKTSLGQESATPLANANQLRVAAYNVENLDLGDGEAKFTNIADNIVNRFKSPDIITLIEVQDNSGPTNDGQLASNLVLDKIVAKVIAAGGPTYSYRYVIPTNNTDGGEPSGNIRQVFLYRTDRGVTFADRPAPAATAATTANSVQSNGALLYNPGRIDPTNTAFNSSRKPLTGEFYFNGQRIVVIGNHLNSKGGDEPLYGKNQPPTLNSEVQRNQQATIIRNFVNQLQAADPYVNIILNGDLNDFETSNPLNILKNGPTASQNLTDALESITLTSDRYTYVFEGNSQSLDHLLYSQTLADNFKGADVIHVNADFYVGAPERVSDHDPVTAVFEFPTPVTSCDRPALGQLSSYQLFGDSFGNQNPSYPLANLVDVSNTPADQTMFGTFWAWTNAPKAVALEINFGVTGATMREFRIFSHDPTKAPNVYFQFSQDGIKWYDIPGLTNLNLNVSYGYVNLPLSSPITAQRFRAVIDNMTAQFDLGYWADLLVCTTTAEGRPLYPFTLPTPPTPNRLNIVGATSPDGGNPQNVLDDKDWTGWIVSGRPSSATLEVTLDSVKTITELDYFQTNSAVARTTDIQYWNSATSAWVTIPGLAGINTGDYSNYGNNQLTLGSPVTTNKIRFVITNTGNDWTLGGYGRVDVIGY